MWNRNDTGVWKHYCFTSAVKQNKLRITDSASEILCYQVNLFGKEDNKAEMSQGQ